RPTGSCPYLYSPFPSPDKKRTADGSAVRSLGEKTRARPRERRAQGRLASSSLSFCLRDWRPVPKTALHLRHPNRRASPEAHPRTVLVPGERLRVLLLRQAG